MDALKKWSAVICIACVICTLIDLLIPQGKMQKTMHMVINIFMVWLAISSFKKSLREFNLNVNNLPIYSKLDTNSEFLENLNSQMSSLAAENVKSIVSAKLREIDVVPKKIEIFMDTNSDNCIVMIRCRIYLEDKYGLLKSKIHKEIAERLNIPTEIIDV